MKTTGPLFICWSLLALVVNTGFLCYPDSGVNESPPHDVHLGRRVTYPDGTPIDSVRVHADNGAYTAEAYTNAAGYYKLTRLAQGINTFGRSRGPMIWWEGSTVSIVRATKCWIGYFSEVSDLHSIGTGTLSLRRYPLADCTLGRPRAAGRFT